MKRPYVQTARAQAAEETGQRILAAAYARLMEAWYDEITLDQVAADAGVTVQTVIRRFGSKEGIVRAITEHAQPAVMSQRDLAPAGDVPGAVANLVDHYEAEGAIALRLLRQEHRVPAFAEVTASGKKLHADWCRRVFAPWLDSRAGVDRRRLEAQVVAICDVYTWDLLSNRQGLSRRQTERALTEMLNGVLS